jgi:hypothetical protein
MNPGPPKYEGMLAIRRLSYRVVYIDRSLLLTVQTGPKRGQIKLQGNVKQVYGNCAQTADGNARRKQVLWEEMSRLSGSGPVCQQRTLTLDRWAVIKCAEVPPSCFIPQPTASEVIRWMCKNRTEKLFQPTPFGWKRQAKLRNTSLFIV